MKSLAIVTLSILILAGIAFVLVGAGVLNRGVIRELHEKPDGDRAKKVMLLELPSGKSIPVNYLQDGDIVYAGADFPWWRELRGEGGEVSVLLRGQTRRGRGRAVEGNPTLRTSIFERLRPTAPSWTGTLVEIHLDPEQGPQASD